MTAATNFLREVIDALPATDPVGAICAAIHRYDRESAAVIEELAFRLVRMDVLTSGGSVAASITRLGLGDLCGALGATGWQSVGQEGS
jgi:hypothetical protein